MSWRRLLLIAFLPLLMPALSHAQSPSSTPVISQPKKERMPVTFNERVVLGKGRPRIVMLGMDAFPQEAWAAVESHTAAELRAAGLKVIKTPTVATQLKARLAELGAQAAQHHAVGAIRVIRRGKRPSVQVWIYDAITRKMLLREATAATEGSSQGPDLAKQVVELLNASLLEIRMRRRRPIPQVPPLIKRMVAATMPEERPGRGEHWSLTVAPAAIFSIDGLDPGAALLLSASGRALPWLALQLETRLSFLPQRFEAADGHAFVTMLVARGLIELEPWRQARWSPSLALGLGALVVRAIGGSAGLNDGTSVTPELALRMALAWRVAPSLHLRASVLLGMPLPEPSIAFAPDAEHGLGVATLEASLGLSWSW